MLHVSPPGSDQGLYEAPAADFDSHELSAAVSFQAEKPLRRLVEESRDQPQQQPGLDVNGASHLEASSASPTRVFLNDELWPNLGPDLEATLHVAQARLQPPSFPRVDTAVCLVRSPKVELEYFTSVVPMRERKQSGSAPLPVRAVPDTVAPNGQTVAHSAEFAQQCRREDGPQDTCFPMQPAQQGCTPSSAGSHLSGGDPVLHNDRTRPLFTEILHDLSYLDIPLLVLFDPPPSLPQAAKVRALGQQPTLTAQRDR